MLGWWALACRGGDGSSAYSLSLLFFLIFLQCPSLSHPDDSYLLLLLRVDHAVAHEPVLEGVVEHVQREGVAQDLDPFWRKRAGKEAGVSE